jgi:hypothetical protein
MKKIPVTYRGLKSKDDIYPMIVEALQESVGLPSTSYYLDYLETVVKRVLLAAINIGLLDRYKWYCDSVIRVTYNRDDPSTVNVLLPKWIIEELDLEEEKI